MLVWIVMLFFLSFFFYFPSGLDAPTHTCSRSPTVWVALPSLTPAGWEPTTLMTFSTSSGSHSPHLWDTGHGTGMSPATWLPTGPTLPKLGTVRTSSITSKKHKIIKLLDNNWTIYFPLIILHSDPNKGESSVPATWPQFTSTGHQYLEIHSKMDASYVKQKMRLRYVHFWSSVIPNLGVTISE